MDYIKMGIKILDKISKVIKKELIMIRRKRKPMRKILVEIAILAVEVIIMLTKKKK